MSTCRYEKSKRKYMHVKEKIYPRFFINGPNIILCSLLYTVIAQ